MLSSRLLPRAAALLSLLLLVACQSSSDEGSPESARGPDGALAASEVAALEARAAVERMIRGEDYEAAIAVADRALEATRAGPHAAALRRMRQVAWDEHVRRDLLNTGIQFRLARVAVGEAIEGEYFVENRSGETVVIAAEAEGTESGGARRVTSRTRFRVELRFVEHHIGGTLATESWSEVRGLDEDIRLEPGERHSFPIRVDSDSISPASINYRTYAVSVRMHPARLSIGRARSTVPLSFGEAVVEVFPRNWEHLAADPMGRLAQCIEKESVVHLPLVAALVPAPHRPAAIDQLCEILQTEDHLPPGPEFRVAICVALRILTEEDLPAQVSAWRAWSRDR